MKFLKSPIFEEEKGNIKQIKGKSYPLGTIVYPDGVQFCIYSKSCKRLELLLFENENDEKPFKTITFDPEKNKTFFYWHIFVPGIKAGILYAYRAYGPFNPKKGQRFNGNKLLIDPYARSVVFGKNYDRDAAILPGDNCKHAMKGVIVDRRSYDWEEDLPLNRPFSKTVIYEMHVDAFTHNPNSGVPVKQRGTYAGLVRKIPYLKKLGITAVELMPVQQFDEQDAPLGHHNYWGYSPVAFFAPHRGYSSRKDPLGPVTEFRDMVKALHREGIEVILDVVFNHTAEGDKNGPTFSLRGLENQTYYILEDDKSEYANYSGCGNTLNTNGSYVRRLIMDCLRFWVTEMHVDGFRFDLASVMARDEEGVPLKNPPILWDIESDPVLAGSKIIAEAWDAAGLYQVGSFIGHRWAEWNGQYRDDIRKFVKSDKGMVKKIFHRITGSPDLYKKAEREPNRSINFITCHDGFTLNDLVSYNNKHNEANGENNLDGSNDNCSWNCGVEGITNDPAINALRLRQMKNFLTILFISQGTPMILMGDEIMRSQNGNNNSYSQNNRSIWFDWHGLKKNSDLLKFTQNIIKFARSQKIFRVEHFWNEPQNGESTYVTWHGVKLLKPDWSNESHSLAFSLNHPNNDEHFHIMLNFYWEALNFELPNLHGSLNWHRIVDTSLPSPKDFCSRKSSRLVRGLFYKVKPRSVVILSS